MDASHPLSGWRDPGRPFEASWRGRYSRRKSESVHVRLSRRLGLRVNAYAATDIRASIASSKQRREVIEWPRGKRSHKRITSDAHRHQHVAVLVLGVWIFGPHLAGRLRVLELQPNLARIVERLEEVENVAGVEADRDRL